ncbi:MAG: hypothetical protein GY896_25715 [Gammaproteobacteria bacterium]|nr:hypothetical protein [Gammaproteobacteria bacterium]
MTHLCIAAERMTRSMDFAAYLFRSERSIRHIRGSNQGYPADLFQIRNASATGS